MFSLQQLVKFGAVSKTLYLIINNEDAYHWQMFYNREFTKESYVDHCRLPNETNKAYLKRSFWYYKHMRRIVEGIINETNARRPDKQ
jgi:hypothetical protein